MCQHRLLILRSRDLSIPGELFKFFFLGGGGGVCLVLYYRIVLLIKTGYRCQCGSSCQVDGNDHRNLNF